MILRVLQVIWAPKGCNIEAFRTSFADQPKRFSAYQRQPRMIVPPNSCAFAAYCAVAPTSKNAALAADFRTLAARSCESRSDITPPDEKQGLCLAAWRLLHLHPASFCHLRAGTPKLRRGRTGTGSKKPCSNVYNSIYFFQARRGPVRSREDFQCLNEL